MERQEQVLFVKELAEHVIADIVKDIEAGKTPEEWNGHELRQLVADRFERCVWKAHWTKKRRREYNNTVLVNNL